MSKVSEKEGAWPALGAEVGGRWMDGGSGRSRRENRASSHGLQALAPSCESDSHHQTFSSMMLLFAQWWGGTDWIREEIMEWLCEYPSLD